MSASARAGGPPAGRVLAAAALAAGLCACRPETRLARLLAREAVLERQVAELSGLVQAAQRGSLLPEDKLVVAVGEAIVNDLVRLALPREQVVAGQYRVRLESAEVRFRDEHGSVRFDGRVGEAGGATPAFFAELALFGVVDSVDVERATGVLSCNVAIVDFQLRSLGLPEQGAGQALLEGLRRQGLDVLRTLAFPIAIPVKLEQEIVLKGASGEGPVRLRPARLPLRLAVADVAAHGRRLWIAVDVSAGDGR